MQLRPDRFDPAAFLRDHWQRQPLLVRNPWVDWNNPLDPDDLAGLACESGVESRLIEGTAPALTLEHGPLDPGRFSTLGARAWTLLVQAVDHHVPDVAALIEPFRFLPNWRIDDVMVSYAADGGGVGPHFDQYDVFLIQGAGRRRWRIGTRCDGTTALAPHDDLRLLASFDPVAEWVLEPGDMLYVPPGVAHDGIAEGDGCMTYSVGFRAPSKAELVETWCDHLLATLDRDERYGDAASGDEHLTPQTNPGEILPAALDRLQAMLLETVSDRAAFARLFGAHATTPRYPEIDWRPERPLTLKRLRNAATKGAALERNPAARFAFIAERADAVQLFVNGERIACAGDTAAFARQVCAGPIVALDPAWPDPVFALALDLCNRGMLAIAG